MDPLGVGVLQGLLWIGDEDGMGSCRTKVPRFVWACGQHFYGFDGTRLWVLSQIFQHPSAGAGAQRLPAKTRAEAETSDAGPTLKDGARAYM